MTDINSVLPRNRLRLVEHWASEIQKALTDDVFESFQQTERFRRELVNVHDEVERRVLETADVIGVTSTGLAQRISTLRHVSCKVIICEEAGEIMEPHMLSAMIPSVEHIISIGDHQQLRPQVSNFDLSLESHHGAYFQLDRSQFERLAVGEQGQHQLPVAQLNVQRRMRPEISSLIRKTLYPLLVDHEVTKSLPDVVGMRDNIWWLDHQNLEDGLEEDIEHKSYSNTWEVEMTYALVRHLVRQGVYASEDIAVLAPYVGQLQKLKKKFREEFDLVLNERDEDALAEEDMLDVSIEAQNPSSHNAPGKATTEKKRMTQLLRYIQCYYYLSSILCFMTDLLNLE